METKLLNVLLAVVMAAAIVSSVGRIAQYNAKHRIISSPIAIPHSELTFEEYRETMKREAICLAQNIYHEARNQPVRGQLAVASVTINRVYSSKFPNTVCGVVYQKNKRGCQFTWICKHRWVDVNAPKFIEKYRLATRILNGEVELEPLNNALYYHADYVRPWWAKYKAFVEQIGAHKFYKERNA